MHIFFLGKQKISQIINDPFCLWWHLTMLRTFSGFLFINQSSVWQDWGWCFPPDFRNVGDVPPKEGQPSLTHHGGLVLSSVLGFSAVPLLWSSFILTGERWQWRRDGDGSYPGCRTGPGLIGEERGAGSISGAEGEGLGGEDEASSAFDIEDEACPAFLKTITNPKKTLNLNVSR